LILVQAGCIRRYVIASLLTRLSSNYQNPDIELIPMPTGDNIPSGQEPCWAGLGQLRRVLTTRSKFYEANALFRVELNRTPLNDREKVITEFLAAIATSTTNAGRHFVEASVRLQWGVTYVLLQALQRAEEEMAKSEEIFIRYCNEFGIADRALTPHLQALRYERLSLLQDPMAKIEKSERLAEELERVQSYKTGVCLSALADLAKLFYQFLAEKTYMDTFFSVQKRLEVYDETVSEDLCDLVRHRNDTSNFTVTYLNDGQKSLEWIDGFFKRYEYFNSPGEVASLFRCRALLLRGLRRVIEADLADKEADRLDALGPSLGKWLHMGSISKNIALQNSEADPNGYDSEDEGADTPFWSPWQIVMGDAGRTKDTAVKLILEWSFADISNGHITIGVFREMLNDTELEIMDVDSADKGIDIVQLKDAHAQKMTSIIFPTENFPNPRQEHSYKCLCDWLIKFPRGERDKRLFCLLMMREARQMHLSDMQFWDLRICELNALLEFYPRLPRHIREFLPFGKGTWLSALAQTYHAQLVDKIDFKDPETAKTLSMAEYYNNAALEELRQRYYPSDVFVQNRCGAQICFMKITRIKQMAKESVLSTEENPVGRNPALDTSVDDLCVRAEIDAIRRIGLEKLKEADLISTESEIRASWDGGLDGLHARQSVTNFQGSSGNIFTAITLLLAEAGGVTSGTLTAIWEWVQKYKARSLARTIGVQAHYPPGLVSQIMASAKARPAYEKLLDLEKQIKEAKPSARFYLRRQLDVHQANMKATDDLLRQLIDLREGTPFDSNDIAVLQDEIGEPFVLVDWFYLPPFLRGDSGRLLLFTARAGSTPTMDVLSTTLEATHIWQNTFLMPRDWANFREENLCDDYARTAFDEELGGLVAPLAHHTKPNEILVLCPSTTLHRLPLHALSIRVPDPEQSNQFLEEGLIHRNPIVYIHSHSLLRSCYSATEKARYSPGAVNFQFLSGIPDAKISYYDEVAQCQRDYTTGRESIKGLSKRFGTEPMLNSTATKTSLMSMVAQSRLLHLHTHCNWDFADPLDHHIELPDVEEAAGQNTGRIAKLTTREIFDMRVLPGTHVNMIACQGGVVEVKPGDEVMGLIPALLYSGASSTLSTLWSIDDNDGAEFAFHFFDSFLRQCVSLGGSELHDGVKGGVDEQLSMNRRSRGTSINIAKAVQYAVIKMDEGQIQPLFQWAAFVTHGFWQFPLSNEDIKRLQKLV
jgi:hypothetical protein